MLEVFPLHDWIGDYRGVMCGSLVNEHKVGIELCPTIDCTNFEIFEIPVQDSSREVVSLDCRPEESQDDLIVLESGDISARRSVLWRYRDRLKDTRNGNASLPTLSLFTCLQLWD
jgi:hypothetical protein